MAHQPMTSFLIYIIEALCASPHSLSEQPEDHHRTLQGNPRDSPKVMLPKDLMTLVLRTKSIAIQWHYTLITGQCDNLHSMMQCTVNPCAPIIDRTVA